MLSPRITFYGVIYGTAIAIILTYCPVEYYSSVLPQIRLVFQ